MPVWAGVTGRPRPSREGGGMAGEGEHIDQTLPETSSPMQFSSTTESGALPCKGGACLLGDVRYVFPTCSLQMRALLRG